MLFCVIANRRQNLGLSRMSKQAYMYMYKEQEDIVLHMEMGGVDIA